MTQNTLLSRAAATVAIAAATLNMSALPGHSAEIWFEPIAEQSDFAVLTLYGEIEEGDADRLVAALQESIQRGYYIDMVNLFSPGGNALEGIKLGRVINRYHLLTQAPVGDGQNLICHGYPGSESQPFSSAADSSCVCASACAIAWMGGVERYGIAGFHSVYSLDPQLTHHQAQEIRLFFDDELETYLEEVGAPNFVEDMIKNTGPEDLSWPDEQQLQQLAMSRTHGLVVHAACNEVSMGSDYRTYFLELWDKSQSSTLTAKEQAHLTELSGAYQQEISCTEEVRRRELSAAQQELL